MKTVIRHQCERHRLDNGLTLLISENPRLPLASVNAFVIAGADQNPMGRAGLAVLTMRLLDEGTRQYTARELAEQIENLGGGMSTFSQREISGVALNLASDNLEAGLAILSEMVCHPVFPDDRFGLERGKLLNQLRAMDDDPQLVGSNLLSCSIYSGTPLKFPILGTPHSIAEATADDVRRFHREKYSPRNTVLTIVGDVRSSHAVDCVERHFSDWRTKGRRTRLPRIARQSQPHRRQIRLDKEQVHLFLGHLGISRGNPDYHALQVMDVILGSGPGFTSRIPRKLRDEQGLAYSIYADITGSAGIYPGRFAAYVSTSPRNLEAVEKGLLHELEVFKKHGPTADELAMAQDFLTGSFVFDFQSNADLARFFFLTEIFDLGVEYPSMYDGIIRSVTLPEVIRVARQYLDTINYTRVAVGPVSELEA